MVKLIDNNKAVEISINEWDDESKQYGYDWASDFFRGRLVATGAESKRLYGC